MKAKVSTMRNVILAKHLITALLFHIMHSNIQKECIERLKISQTLTYCASLTVIYVSDGHMTDVYQSQNWIKDAIFCVCVKIHIHISRIIIE